MTSCNIYCLDNQFDIFWSRIYWSLFYIFVNYSNFYENYFLEHYPNFSLNTTHYPTISGNKRPNWRTSYVEANNKMWLEKKTENWSDLVLNLYFFIKKIYDIEWRVRKEILSSISLYISMTLKVWCIFINRGIAELCNTCDRAEMVRNNNPPR